MRLPVRGRSSAPARVSAWVDVVEEGFRTALIICVGVGAASVLVIAPGFYREPKGWAVVGLGLVGVGQVLMLSALWRRWRGRWTSALIVGSTIVGLILAVPHMTLEPGVADAWWPRTLLVAGPSYLVIMHRRGWIAAGALIGTNAVLHALYWRPVPTLPGLTMAQEVAAEAGQFTAYCGIAVIAASVTRKAAQQADRAVAAERRAHRDAAAGRFEATLVEEADRFVHDEVLHTLRAIAFERAFVPADSALGEARRLRRMLEVQVRAPADEGFVGNLRARTNGLGLDVDVTGPPDLSLPNDVAEPLVLAARECLKNVALHAGVERAQVQVRHSDYAVAVVIVDQGRGFDPERPTSRLGLRRSVHDRMEAIGGSANVVSAPGQGTQVHLRWSPLPEGLQPRAAQGRMRINDLFPSLDRLILPMFAQAIWAALILADLTRAPLLSLSATALCVAAGLTALAVGARRGLSGRDSIALGAIAWALAGSAVWLLPDPSAHPRLLWVAVTCTALPSVISLYRPTWEVVVMGSGLTVVVITALLWFHPSQPLTPNLPILLSPVITVGVAVAVRRLIDRCAFEIWAHRERRHDQLVGLGESNAFSTRVDQRLAEVRPELIAFLDQILQHPEMLHEDAVRDRAARLEGALRESISRRTEPTLAQAVARLRDDGWTVHMRWEDRPPRVVLTAAASALQLLPDHPPPTDSGEQPVLTLSALTERDHWRLSLLVRPAGGTWVETFTPGTPWAVTRDDALHAVWRSEPSEVNA